MRSMMCKTTLREIKNSFGRYVAILAIVALGVGFFSGLKITKSAMLETGNSYINEQGLFDYRLISTVGFDDGDIERLQELDGISLARASVSEDFLSGGSSASVIRAHSISEGINEPCIIKGRMPQSDNECVADYRMFTEGDLGKKIELSKDNKDDVFEKFKYREYTVVGIVSSPYYLNFERGTTSLGVGSVSGYIYIPYGGFNVEYDTEVFLRLGDNGGFIYSEEYKKSVEYYEDSISQLCKEITERRYKELIIDSQNEIDEARTEYTKAENEARAELEAALNNLNDSFEKYEENKQKAEKELSDSLKKIEDSQAELDEARKKLDGRPLYYVLTRSTNIGYVCFENDSNIVDGISTVFPVFFFLVAALVCMTTMNRMVDEQRTQIGILKALGYSNFSIMGKYIFYSGSAATIGCISGYILGIYIFPKVIWSTYSIMYGFAPLRFVFSAPLALISLAVSLVCSVGATWISCRYELFEVPAQLIRPKSPKSGKRILLERIEFIWKRLKFLHKVSARNIFRYKKRFIMMVLGISGCTALLVTGFGLKDSITNIVADQYGDIVKYDFTVSFADEKQSDEMDKFVELCGDKISGCCFVYEGSMTVDVPSGSKSITVIAPCSSDNFESFVDIHAGKNKIAYPSDGEAVVSKKFAEKNSISKGDEIFLRNDDMEELKLTVSEICDNYVFSYIYVSQDSFVSQLGKAPVIKNAYVNAAEGSNIHEVSAKISNIDGVSGITVNQDTRERFEAMIKSLDYVVALITFCAGALAFIVLYNLTNINITERVREIATLKVLGFNPFETALYVFREGMVLTGIGALLGLGLGVGLHSFVMSNIDMEIVSFNLRITFLSFFLSFLLTFVFACIVNIAMYFKLERINMAESLKSIE